MYLTHEYILTSLLRQSPSTIKKSISLVRFFVLESATLNNNPTHTLGQLYPAPLPASEYAQSLHAKIYESHRPSGALEELG